MIMHGDCRERLREIQPGSVQCCVTSPPYWGLRDYGTATWEGGEPGCAHIGSIERLAPPGTDKQASNRGTVSVRSGDCACGARRIDSQLGLEPTPEQYVANMVEVFRLVRDALADAGTLWLNLGDSYASKPAGANGFDDGRANREERLSAGVPFGLKPKDLVGIPWRVAFALQADGWYLRSDIIWAKPNPMPESVTDRPTKAHEYLFLLSKRARYYYDAEAIAEPAVSTDGGPLRVPDGWATGGTAHTAIAHSRRERRDKAPVGRAEKADRNRRTVWTIATQPYAEAHFATFPPALVEPCILAGSRIGDLVLDPFGGSGTVGQVAQKLGRRYVLIELNEKYLPLIERRVSQQAMVLA